MSPNRTLITVVEGHGEDDAVPVLLRRYLEREQAFHVSVARPFRTKRNAVVREGELERTVRAAVALRRTDGEDCSLLVLLDADDDCPVTLASTLEARAEAVLDCPVGVVIANREAEAWLLADAEGLAEQFDCSLAAEPPIDVDGVRGAKEWLRQHLDTANRYSPTQDQARWFARIDLEKAEHRSRSLRKFAATVSRLVAEDV
jgi:hypothetical protein